MGMNVGSSNGDEDEVMSNINTTPLVDVMLVLLIIFLITVPVVLQTVDVDLPKAENIPTQTKPENISISVDKDGSVFWGMEKMANNAELLDRVKEAALKKPQPEVHIRADKNTRFEYVGRVVVTCQRGGIGKVGFITDPERVVPNM
ncbi:ExbD/TolR family protein [Govanella unica]|uniref:Biopolymer transporter ExbD n=1 Tax=Govanella unica TaxID=2975056 RepID=A0A9X3U181_9PROT|nr:biopolymer transporter ExbD [Govania unica]MDA5194754.1 biopolymer transporter ExbD [Govania unica]